MFHIRELLIQIAAVSTWQLGFDIFFVTVCQSNGPSLCCVCLPQYVPVCDCEIKSDY